MLLACGRTRYGDAFFLECLTACCCKKIVYLNRENEVRCFKNPFLQFGLSVIERVVLEKRPRTVLFLLPLKIKGICDSRIPSFFA